MSKIIKLGVIGLGRGKNVMTDILGEDNVKLHAICDRNPQKLADALAHFEKLGEKELLSFHDYDQIPAINSLEEARLLKEAVLAHPKL